MSIASCCLQGFKWDGQPTGRIDKVVNLDTYVTGTNTEVAVLFIHDLLGWTFPNARLLADHYASEAGVTVYLPDFFGGEIIPFEPALKGRWQELDLHGFLARNGREAREPEIFAVARALRDRHAKFGAVGFCYGGWAVARLAAEEHSPPILDAAVIAHPSLLTKEDVSALGAAVPLQIQAPENDFVYTRELKTFTFETLQARGVPFDYIHLPGVEHGCMIRGDPDKPGERAAMEQGKNAAVVWFQQFLQVGRPPITPSTTRYIPPTVPC